MTSLHQYVRDKKNNPIGVVVAVKIGDKIHCGWSLTKRKSGDKFNKETGMSIALGRAITNNTYPPNLPHTVNKLYHEMIVRASRYFKDCSFA